MESDYVALIICNQLAPAVSEFKVLVFGATCLLPSTVNHCTTTHTQTVSLVSWYLGCNGLNGPLIGF